MAMATPSKARGGGSAAARRGLSPWLAPSPGKRWTELFFLLYSPTWILWCLCILVPFKIYEVRRRNRLRVSGELVGAPACVASTSDAPCSASLPAPPPLPCAHAWSRPLPDLPPPAAQRLGTWGYGSLGLIAALPCVLLPPLLQPASERGKPLAQRFWVKANLWVAIFSFIGNYFWTHYFYRLLGASYTFPAHRLNEASVGWARVAGRVVHSAQAALHARRGLQPAAPAEGGSIGPPRWVPGPPPLWAPALHLPTCLQVPITLYFMTHAYFCLYHALANILIRRVRHAVAAYGSTAQVGVPPAGGPGRLRPGPPAC